MAFNEKYAFESEACTFIARLKTCEANSATHTYLYLYRESSSNVIFFGVFTACYVLGMSIFHANLDGLKIIQNMVCCTCAAWVDNIFPTPKDTRSVSRPISKSLGTSSLVF